MRKILAIKLKVQCVDGTTHSDVTLAVENNKRLYLATDGTEISGVDCVEECTAIVPPMMLAMMLHACEECQP